MRSPERANMLKVLYVLLMNEDYTIGCCCSLSPSNNADRIFDRSRSFNHFGRKRCAQSVGYVIIRLTSLSPANVGRPSHVAAPILLNAIVHPEPICLHRLKHPSKGLQVQSRLGQRIALGDTRSRDFIPSDSAAGT